MKNEEYFQYIKNLRIYEEDKEALRKKREAGIKQEEKRASDIKKVLEHYKLVHTAQKGIALLGAFVFVGSIALVKEGRKHGIGMPKPVQPAVIEEVDDDIVMTTYYMIELNDTLTSISKRTGISINDIQRDNDIPDPNRIQMNQNLVLNYKVKPENLDYYTENTVVGERNIQDIATRYKTTQETLYRLNKENIIKNSDGTYTIKSNSIKVPNFITQEELKEAKGHQK